MSRLPGRLSLHGDPRDITTKTNVNNLIAAVNMLIDAARESGRAPAAGAVQPATIVAPLPAQIAAPAADVGGIKAADAGGKPVRLLYELSGVDAVAGLTADILPTAFAVEIFMVVVTVETLDGATVVPEIALEVVPGSEDVCQSRSIGLDPANLAIGKRFVFGMSELMAGVGAGETLLARFVTPATATELTLGFKTFGWQA